MKRTTIYMAVALIALCVAAYAQQKLNGIKIGPNPSSTTFEVTGTGDLVFTEKAALSSTPGAGFGYLYVDNTTPSTLKFVDDAGSEFNLGSATFGSSTITSLTQVTPVSGDFLVGTDASDSNNLKKFDIADVLGAGGGITDGDTLTSGLTFPNTGLHILDTNASHDLIIAPGSNITADRTLTIITGDQDRSLQVSGTANVGTGTFTGTNTGDVTLAGTPDYITRSSQVLTLGLIDQTADITGITPVANGGTGLSALGTAGQVLTVNGGATALEYTTPAGGGDMVTVGTPSDGQVGIWTGDGTMEGDASLTFDTTDDTLVIAASGKLGFGAVDILTDSAGTTTLGNIDALDATTEGTIESAIDTLANLTSIQGNSFTVSGTTTISGTNTGDQDISALTTGPGATVTDNAVARFNGTGGLTIQESPVTIADTTGNMAGVGTLNTHTIPGGTGTLALTSDITVTASSTNTFTNKRMTKRTGTTTSSATPTINTDDVDIYIITAQAADITSFTTNLSGTPTEGQMIQIAITGTAARAITWGASFIDGLVASPTTTITTQRLDTLWQWSAGASKWRCMAAGPLS